MVHHILWHLAANPYNVTAKSINLPTSTGTVGNGLTRAVDLLMSIVGGLAMIFIVVGGIQMALSAGNSKRVEQAKETILYSAVGLAVAIGAYAIVSFISGAVNGGH
ncbi:MAG TPA: pilin [Candidatus Saccharimonadia bacterium]|nr:pilin [Candidatus Saccharimonadia bacterium]